ncbi:large tegument protein [Macropodid alphaherpesvirus 2]|uniref:Large tegument protein n=1 Tax=Macropodid alphaherpesvirus 2 TaxID=83440 RepID=A0AAE7SYU9_9ALPH|nr:large tegument protein [Macropodid alphaherpesvirus 2]QOD40184.1 large tegument protein [Macropodid alphaherpesvirus 2]WGO49728.1 large tegument protein [Macropodid alphaherpesvirus 2]
MGRGFKVGSGFVLLTHLLVQVCCGAGDPYALKHHISATMSMEDRRIVVTGPRNQFSPDLEPGGSVSCMRSSLSFLSLVFDVGLRDVLSADAIDWCLVEGREWTQPTNSTNVARMCAAVELPNWLRYSNSIGLRCIFSRVYGDVGFFSKPTPGLLDTQCSAHTFFYDVWSKRHTSFTLVTIGAVGLGLYREGDDAYIFDPHGLIHDTPAFIAKVRAGDVYTYLTYYTHRNKDAQWAGVMIFFAPSGPGPVSVADLRGAALQLYGESETYLQDEVFVERSVNVSHPLRNDTISPRGWVIGAIPPPKQDTPAIPDSTTPPTPSNIWEDALSDPIPQLMSPVLTDTSPEMWIEDDQFDSMDITVTPTPRLNKRRRAAWTPPSSTEDLTVNPQQPKRASSTRHPPTDTSRRKPKSVAASSAEPPKAATLSPEQTQQLQKLIAKLQARVNPTPPATDLSVLLTSLEELKPKLANLHTQASTITDEVDVCSQITIPALKPPNTQRGLLEHCIIFIIDHILAFLIENGTQTHPRVGIPDFASKLFDLVVKALPQKTAISDFLVSTHMTLSEATAHLPLLQHVIDENSYIGKLALAKLVLVSRDVIRTTDAFYGELADLEHRLRHTPPDKLYPTLSEWLLQQVQTNSNRMLAPSTPSHPEPLLQRIQKLAQFAKAEELKAENEDIALRRALLALSQTVDHATQQGGPLIIRPGPQYIHQSPRPPLLTPEEIKANLEDIRSRAANAIDTAVRDYFHKGVKQSANTLTFDKTNERRFHLPPSIISPIMQLVESLPSFDAHLSEVAQHANIPPPPSLLTSAGGLLLNELIQLTPQIETPEGLSAWLTVLEDGLPGGSVSRKELEEVVRMITKINEQHARRTSGLVEFSRFEKLDAAIVDELESLDAFSDGQDVKYIEEGGLSPLLKQTVEDALQQAKTMEATKLTQDLPSDVRAKLAERVRELTRILADAQDRASQVHNNRAVFFKKVQHILRPLPSFGGLKVAPTTLAALETDIPEGWKTITEAMGAAPVDVKTTLKADLWVLVDQYRAALERPTPDTDTALTGIAATFATVLKTLFPDDIETPHLLHFFSDHASLITRALTEAITASSAAVATANPKMTVDAATNVHKVLTDAIRDLSPAIQDPTSPLAFLIALKEDAAGHVKATELAFRARTAIADLTSLGVEVTDLVAELRKYDLTDGGDPAPILDSTAHTTTKIRKRVGKYEEEFGGLLQVEGATGDQSPSSRALQELKKLITATYRRADELMTAADELKTKIADRDARDSGERWAADINAALDRMESQQDFNVLELRRLAALAETNKYNLRDYRKRAEQVLATNSRIVTLALQTVLAFNPFTPENQQHPKLPPLTAIRNITWGPAFHAAADILAQMFLVDVNPLAQLLNTTAGLLSLAQENGGFLDYYVAAKKLSEDLPPIPALQQQVSFFLKGHLEYIKLGDALDTIRAAAHRAVGNIPLELAVSAQQIDLEDGDYTTIEELVRKGVILACPSEDLLEEYISRLEHLDQTPLKDTAYAEYIAATTRQDLLATKRMLVRAKQHRAEATEKITRDLRTLLANRDKRAAAEAENINNLKTLLKVVSAPPAISKTLDQARSAADVIDQIAVLIHQTEKTDELDSLAILWLEHAQKIFNTHPLGKGVDGSCPPLSRYEARIEALITIQACTATLTQSLQAAEAEWDEAWSNFKRSYKEAWSTSDALLIAREHLRVLNMATNTIIGLRGDSHYDRILSKYHGVLTAKMAERTQAMQEFGTVVARYDKHVTMLREISKQVVWEMKVDVLQGLMDEFAVWSKDLPKWVLMDFQATKDLLRYRLGFYTAYSQSPHNDKQLIPTLLTEDVNLLEMIKYNGAPYPKGDISLLQRRAGSYLRHDGASKSILLRETTSELDLPFATNYLLPSGAPLQYTICYPFITDKLGALLLHPEAAYVLPILPAGILESTSVVAAMQVLSILGELQLNLSEAQSSNFTRFGRLINHRRADWDSGPAAVAEIYSALVAVTMTREFGCRLDKMGWQNGALIPHLITEPTTTKHKPVTFNVNDILVALTIGNPEHIYNFWRLDLHQQHDYMQITLPSAWENSLATLFIQRLTPHSNPMVRTLPTFSPSASPTHGLLFGTRVADWQRTKISTTDPLFPWRAFSEMTSGSGAVLGSLSPQQALTAISVLGRMCLPSHALRALWTHLVPDGYAADRDSWDRLLVKRLSPTDTYTTSIGAEGIFSTPPPLYVPTGQQLVLHAGEADLQSTAQVTAMDLVIAATLLGAPVVVAVTNEVTFSRGSELLLCLTVFDSRKDGPDEGLLDLVSNNIDSWAPELLHLDPNAIENACLAPQLTRVSNLLNSRPLRNSSPCLILVDMGMVPVEVLWEQPDPPGPLDIKIQTTDSIEDLPFLSSYEETLGDLRSPLDPFFSTVILGERFQISNFTDDLFKGVPIYKHMPDNPFPFVRQTTSKPAGAQGAAPTLNNQPLRAPSPPVLAPYPTVEGRDNHSAYRVYTWVNGLEGVESDDSSSLGASDGLLQSPSPPSSTIPYRPRSTKKKPARASTTPTPAPKPQTSVTSSTPRKGRSKRSGRRQTPQTKLSLDDPELPRGPVPHSEKTIIESSRFTVPLDPVSNGGVPVGVKTPRIKSRTSQTPPANQHKDRRRSNHRAGLLRARSATPPSDEELTDRLAQLSIDDKPQDTKPDVLRINSSPPFHIYRADSTTSHGSDSNESHVTVICSKPTPKRMISSPPSPPSSYLASWKSIQTLSISPSSDEERSSPNRSPTLTSPLWKSADSLAGETSDEENFRSLRRHRRLSEESSQDDGGVYFGPPPLIPNKMLSHRYVSREGKSALSLLIQACLRLQQQIRQTRRALAAKSEQVINNFYHVRMLLG